MAEKAKLILDDYFVGGELVYGLKIRDATPAAPDKAGAVLLPTHAPHTRFYFALYRQEEIITELAKRISNGWRAQGVFGKRCLNKINQCSRIIEYYSIDRGAWQSQQM